MVEAYRASHSSEHPGCSPWLFSVHEGAASSQMLRHFWKGRAPGLLDLLVDWADSNGLCDFVLDLGVIGFDRVGQR